ncbi:hypothetical protein BDV98DRAFT_421291 [Pterulicium gracile]|uniref:Uncharacterized protein n=1 Tax=Pterulicium gracile TaxID=1884261 RepID=A0A5C3Q2A3_9AGAR|nr:hypothetical protein BDV98DRAFT_421291 [Pterula gracilis]
MQAPAGIWCSRDELERRLRRAENRVANAERRARETEERQEPGEADTSSQGPLIPRPPRVSRIHVGDLREMLGVSKPEWDNLRTTIPHNAQAARLDYDRDLRNQKSNKLTKLCNAIRNILLLHSNTC